MHGHNSIALPDYLSLYSLLKSLYSPGIPPHCTPVQGPWDENHAVWPTPKNPMKTCGVSSRGLRRLAMPTSSVQALLVKGQTTLVASYCLDRHKQTQSMCACVCGDGVQAGAGRRGNERTHAPVRPLWLQMHVRLTPLQTRSSIAVTVQLSKAATTTGPVPEVGPAALSAKRHYAAWVTYVTATLTMCCNARLSIQGVL